MYSSRLSNHEKIARILKKNIFDFVPETITNTNTTEFFKDHFKASENKTTTGDKSQFNAILYEGINLESEHIFCLISDNSDANLNPEQHALILSYFGIGYIYSNGKTKLLAGWESDEFISRLDKIEDTNFTFNGKPYNTFQEKYDAEINKIETSTKTDFEEEKKQLERREQQLHSKNPSKNLEKNKLDNDIIEVKKIIVTKRKSLTDKAQSKVLEVSKKQGNLETLNSNMYSTIGGKDLIEVFQLESKLEELEASKKLLNPSLKAKDKTNAELQIVCAKKRQLVLNAILEDYNAIDNKFGINSQQGFLKKMELINTKLTPALQNRCK
ncbi:MAG: hypothetical protein KDC97_13625, partial [Confluentibacter sp.]|nr:hypothetical protein [Confluentibacter sp.]